MQLAPIQNLLSKYKEYIQTSEYENLYKWEAIKNFQDNWNMEAENFHEMFDKCLQCSNEVFWKKPLWFPKETMLAFIKYDPELLMGMFEMLFDEQKPVLNRMDIFQFHCDEILIQFQRHHDKKLSQHFHSNFEILSCYLALRFPETYAVYEAKAFAKFLEIVKAKSSAGQNERERFFKLCNTISKVIARDEELIEIHQSLLTEKHFTKNNLMLAQDFISFAAL